MIDTAATFIPISYIVLAFLRRKQFSSVKVVPALIPKICVCTAPATPIVHKSELLFAPNCGEIADAGGDFTVVSIEPFVVIVLLVVESVTIGSAKAKEVVITNTIAVTIFLNINHFLTFPSTTSLS